MVNKTIVLWLLLLTAWSARAQTTRENQRFKDALILLAGMNYSSVSSVNSANPDGRLGVMGGAAYRHYIGKLGWFIKPGFNFSQEGWLHKRLSYLNMPIQVGFDFTDDFNLNLGLQYGFLTTNLSDPQGIIDRNNFAILLGVEFYPSNALEIGLRFANGVNNIIKKPDAIVIKDARTYAITFYFAFVLGQKE